MIHIQGLPWPPTMNHRLIYFNKMMRKNPDHRKFEANLRMILHKKYLTTYPDLQGKKLSVQIFYEGPPSQWFTKKGEIKKVDADNRHKNLLDVIMPFFDLDDSQIWEINIKKVSRDVLTETTASVYIQELK